mgnify:CR=1 FL=1
MLYEYYLSNTSFVTFFVNSVFQKWRLSSKVKPTPFKNKPYYNQPKCFKWWFALKAEWRASMQGGKCYQAIKSIFARFSFPWACDWSFDEYSKSIKSFSEIFFKSSFIQMSLAIVKRWSKVNFKICSRYDLNDS